jgi:hypothetical protein
MNRSVSTPVRAVFAVAPPATVLYVTTLLDILALHAVKQLHHIIVHVDESTGWNVGRVEAASYGETSSVAGANAMPSVVNQWTSPRQAESRLNVGGIADTNIHIISAITGHLHTHRHSLCGLLAFNLLPNTYLTEITGIQQRSIKFDNARCIKGLTLFERHHAV